MMFRLVPLSLDFNDFPIVFRKTFVCSMKFRVRGMPLIIP